MTVSRLRHLVDPLKRHVVRKVELPWSTCPKWRNGLKICGLQRQLGVAEHNPAETDQTMIGLMEAGERLGICIRQAKSRAQQRILSAAQILLGSSSLAPVEALASDAGRIGVQRVINRCFKCYEQFQPDFDPEGAANWQRVSAAWMAERTVV